MLFVQVQSDDLSHLLLLSRRNPGVEPTLFAAELKRLGKARDVYVEVRDGLAYVSPFFLSSKRAEYS